MNYLEPREVLAYLNELGYHNITAEQLKEFMKDLKKLIKHDQRSARSWDKENRHDSSFSNVFANLHSTSTVSSRAKCVPKHEKVITLHITRPRPPSGVPNRSDEDVSPENRSRVACDLLTDPATGTNTSGPTNVASASRAKPKSCLKDGVRPKTAESRGKDADLKPKVSFIRPRLPAAVHASKSDPVALYHYYQNEWKKQKMPGEDARADLRWAIRERMLGAGDKRTFSVASSTETLHRKKSK